MFRHAINTALHRMPSNFLTPKIFVKFQWDNLRWERQVHVDWVGKVRLAIFNQYMPIAISQRRYRDIKWKVVCAVSNGAMHYSNNKDLSLILSLRVLKSWSVYVLLGNKWVPQQLTLAMHHVCVRECRFQPTLPVPAMRSVAEPVWSTRSSQIFFTIQRASRTSVGTQPLSLSLRSLVHAMSESSLYRLQRAIVYKIVTNDAIIDKPVLVILK